MTITKNMIDKFIKIEISQNSSRSKNMEQLAKLFEQFFKYQQDMQSKMNNLKKVSLAETFVQVRRDVRTLSDRLSKPVELIIEGEKINVDDTLIEPISSSLVHIVRNSIDHGLETAEERKAAGKFAKGSLLVEAYEDEDRIFIEIKDDGRGIDPEKLRKAIVEKGIFTETEAAKFDKKELVNMIFKSGVSTSSKVTDVSGRGIGLDMVYSSIIQIQGRIDVESEIGKGTKFTLNLPLPKSVVIFRSLVVSRDGCAYAIPQEHIIQVLSATEQELLNSNAVETVSGKTTLRMKSQTFPLFDLLNILENKPKESFEFKSSSTIVIIQGMHRPYGITVDAVLGIEDTVVKTLDQISDISQIYMGATIFADGQVGMIINPSGVTKTLEI
ncbi:MAG: ATP-binding protein [Pseudomonadota bacterium]|nr:ATP-binding protein [Pseudomonadota bacterium]